MLQGHEVISAGDRSHTWTINSTQDQHRCVSWLWQAAQFSPLAQQCAARISTKLGAPAYPTLGGPTQLVPGVTHAPAALPPQPRRQTGCSQPSLQTQTPYRDTRGAARYSQRDSTDWPFWPSLDQLRPLWGRATTWPQPDGESCASAVQQLYGLKPALCEPSATMPYTAAESSAEVLRKLVNWAPFVLLMRGAQACNVPSLPTPHRPCYGLAPQAAVRVWASILHQAGQGRSVAHRRSQFCLSAMLKLRPSCRHSTA